MINRTTMPVTTWPDAKTRSHPSLPSPLTGLTNIHRELLSGSLSSYLWFLLFLLASCGLTCLYLWQLSTVHAIQVETVSLRSEVTEYENNNVSLMLEVAAGNTPAQIENNAVAMGMVPVTPALYLAAPVAPATVVETPDQTRVSTSVETTPTDVTALLTRGEELIARFLNK